MEFLIIILVAVVVGLVVGIVVYCRSEAKVKQRIAALDDEYKKLIESLRKGHNDEINKKKDMWDNTFNEQKKALKEVMNNRFNAEMNDRSETLKDNNADAMKNILNPMEKQLRAFEEMVTKNLEEHKNNYTNLDTIINTLKEHNNERKQIVQAIANKFQQPKMQGNWGEQVLNDILIDSGLRVGYEYFTQAYILTKEGTSRYPDVVVKLPDGTNLIIDSKVSLNAYSDYVNAETEEERKEASKRNKDAILARVKELSGKDYKKIVGSEVPFVLMFTPIEGSYLLAMNADPELGIKAWRENKVVIVNPTNLMTVLSLVSTIWKNTRYEESANKIYTAAREIYDKYQDFDKIFVKKFGEKLRTTEKHYETGRKTLIDSKSSFKKKVNELLLDIPKNFPQIQPSSNDMTESITTSNAK